MFWKNVSPVPAFPYNLFPYIAAGWLVIALVIVFAFPRVAHRIGLNLASATDQENADRGWIKVPGRYRAIYARIACGESVFS